MNPEILIILSKLMQFWNGWELRILMALNVCLQMLLCTHSFFRFGTKNKWFSYTASLAHTSSYWIAAYGLKVMIYDSNTSFVPNELVVMWSPFFLFHLGAVSFLNFLNVEDEYLWLKQSFYVVLYSLSVIFIVIRSSPDKHMISVTLGAFLLAFVRNCVLIRTLLSQKDELFKDSSQQENLPVEEVEVTTLSKILKAFKRQVYLRMDRLITEGNPERQYLMSGDDLYNKFKAFIRRRSHSSELRSISKSLFTNLTAKQAFSLLSCEFYAMDHAFYHVKYTHSFLYFVLKFVFVKTVLWDHRAYYKLAWSLGFCNIDFVITDFMLCSFMFLEYIHFLEDRRYGRVRNPRGQGFSVWSESMYVLNLVDWCLGVSNAAKFAALCGREDVVDNIRLHFSISVKEMDDDAKQMIFHNIREKSMLAGNNQRAMEIGNMRGDGALRKYSMYNQLKWSLTECEYGEAIILWHIATDLCLAKDLSDVRSPQLEFCKTISEYMLYLIVLEDKLMAPVVGQSSSVFKDTCSGVKKLFHYYSITEGAEARQGILSDFNGLRPRRDKSVLNDAIELAKRLLRVPDQLRWRLMRDVWIELLSYAAFHSTPLVHVKQPGQGGELLSFVWLLMNHLGIGKQFWEEDAARALHHLD